VGDHLAPLDQTLRALRGRALSSGERDAFGRYLDLLLRWNRTHDLTAFRTEAEVVGGLFRDSLLFLRALGDLAGDAPRVVDIGAGAGIPGLPLRLVLPSLRLTLVEARRKRVSFLRAVQRELALVDVEVREGRSDAVLSEHPELAGRYDVALGRGIAAGELLEAALPYLRPGGLLAAGGPPEAPEVPEYPGYSGIEWRRERFASLRISRTFLIARKYYGN
jgi:16S rRNA (guanine527-N7)-methyltransferase